MRYDARGGRAAVPQAAAPVARARPGSGLGDRRALRHRAPRAAQRAAQARPGPRAPRPVLAAARHPARVGAAAVGGAPDRGAARRPGRDVHQDPPRAGRRCLRDAAAGERAEHRPRPARHAAPRGRDRPQRARPRGPPDKAGTLRRRADRRRCGGARHHRRGRRHARRAGQDAAPGPPQRDLVALALRPADDPQPADHRRPAASPPRTGRSSGCAAIGKATGTTINDVVLAMCSGAMRAYLLELDALPDTVAGRDGAGRPQRQAVPDRLRRGRQRGRLGDGPARHRSARPGRPARDASTRRCATARRRCRR